MGALDGSHKHVRVCKDAHLLTVRIEAFSVQRFIGNQWGVRKTVRPLLKLTGPFLASQAAETSASVPPTYPPTPSCNPRLGAPRTYYCA